MRLYDNDEYREEFMAIVYGLLMSDGTNDRANQIISAFDCAPEVEAEPVQPNDPLTLEELREMDGEPVWWWNTSAKPVCTICVIDLFMKEPMFANYDFMSEDTVKLTKYKWLIKCGYKPYRRKPEEGA